MLKKVIEAYCKAERRIFFLDYDGTLVPFTKNPVEAWISGEMIHILDRFCGDTRNRVVIISGRDKDFLERQFAGMKADLVAEHGYWIKEMKKSWQRVPGIGITWKEQVRLLFNDFVLSVPGSFLEEKDASIAFHYRNVRKDSENEVYSQVIEKLNGMVMTIPGMEVLEGNKVVEVKPSFYNKGTAAAFFLKKEAYDFILAAGDDVTDEELFGELPLGAYSIKVGRGNTSAKYTVDELTGLKVFLAELLEKSDVNGPKI